MRVALSRGMDQLGLAIDSARIEKLLLYVELLQRWNRVYNLTSIAEANQVPHLLLDSLSIAPWLVGRHICDVGSGGGLPGIPLAILFPERRFVLLDGNGKKTRFLEQARIELGLGNVSVIKERVEHYEGQFDVVTCRAFASLADIAGLTAHLLGSSACVLAMKGHLADAELAQDISPLCIDRIVSINVPGVESERQLVILKKIAGRP